MASPACNKLKQEVATTYAANESATKTAEIHGVAHSSVYKWIKELGVFSSTDKNTSKNPLLADREEEYKALRHMVNDGIPLKMIKRYLTLPEEEILSFIEQTHKSQQRGGNE